MNNNEQIVVIFLDVEKAFDRNWHDSLLFKMVEMKIPMSIIKIIESFLKNRSFTVKINGKMSNLKMVNSGLSQGSCLSPTLFTIFTNDIPVVERVKVALFADNTIFTAKKKQKFWHGNSSSLKTSRSGVDLVPKMKAKNQ